MDLRTKLKLNTKVYCPSPLRGFGYVREVLNEGKPLFFSEDPLMGLYSFEAVFPDVASSSETSMTGVFYLTAQQVVDNIKINKNKEDVLWVLDYTWQYTQRKYRKLLKLT